MFSSIFGKRRSSPVENDTPPIPGPKPDEGFEVVDPSRGLYPSVSSIGGPGGAYPARPAPPAPVIRAKSVDNFHYLQGVPFQMSKELQLASSNSFTTEISDLLAFLTSKVNVSQPNYDFNLEQSVLKEC